MFERLFPYPAVLQRHRTGLLAAEREAFDSSEVKTLITHGRPSKLTQDGLPDRSGRWPMPGSSRWNFCVSLAVFVLQLLSRQESTKPC